MTPEEQTTDFAPEDIDPSTVARLTVGEMDEVISNIAGDYDPHGLSKDIARIMADRLHEALHAAWLAIHVRRFDGPEPPEYGERTSPDSIYKGIQLAERALGDVATARGIYYHALRTPAATEEADRG